MGLRWRGRPTASRRDYDSEMMSCMSHDFVPREIAMILIHLPYRKCDVGFGNSGTTPPNIILWDAPSRNKNLWD